MNPKTQYTIDAPTGALTVVVDIADTTPEYAVSYDGIRLIDPSALGIEFEDRPDLTGPFEIIETSENSVDETWEPVWGADAEVRNHYNERHFRLAETGSRNRLLELTFRVFDDGFGFRYTLPEQNGIEEFAIAAERSEFRFAEDFTAWWIPAEEMGPRPCSWIDSYEKIYSETPLSEMPRANTPITIEAAEDIYVSLHEAALIDYADMEPTPIEGEAHAFESGLVALPDGTKVKGETPHRSPWRTLLVGEDPGDLIESPLVENLNEACEFEDTSWIEPGKYVGVWWEMHKGAAEWSGPNVGATTENVKRYIDFAADHDIPYVLAEGWNAGWGPDPKTTDFTRAHENFDLEEVLEYCAEAGVEFLAHAETNGNVEAFEAELEETFEWYERNGIPGVKTGYAGEIAGHHHHDQWMVNHHRTVARVAAEHHLLIDVHEPIKPTGESRTYPNFMSREGVRGMEINASATLGNGNPPEHTVTLPFTRMVAGPLDYTPGIFEVLWDPAENGTRVHTTRARQLALYPILLSGLQMVADIPEHYEGRPEFAFVEQVPATWDETRVINAAIGEYITVARRSATEWYVGTATDEQPRTLDIALDFLGGGQYVAEIYSDAPDADIDENPTAVRIEECLVDASVTIPASMVSGGGQAIRLHPASEDEAAAIPEYDPDRLPVHD